MLDLYNYLQWIHFKDIFTNEACMCDCEKVIDTKGNGKAPHCPLQDAQFSESLS